MFGLSIAALCVRSGAKVTLFDPRRLGQNASGVAAGMLAPGLEAVLEQATSCDHQLLRQGYDAWPSFAADAGVSVSAELRAGAIYVGTEAETAGLCAALVTLGAPVRKLSLDEARVLQPGLAASDLQALYVEEDGRLDPQVMLRELEQVVRDSGGDIRREAFTMSAARDFEAVVAASGYESRAWIAHAPELACLQPIKGHVLHYTGGVTSGPVVRSRAGYAAPRNAGTVFGATMEVGCSSLELNPHLIDGLRRAAVDLFPVLNETPFTALTGVRAAAPDGRPMVGRTAGGVYVATGARRNGWLLAPVVARAMVRALQGAAPEPAFDPARFTAATAFTHA